MQFQRSRNYYGSHYFKLAQNYKLAESDNFNDWYFESNELFCGNTIQK